MSGFTLQGTHYEVADLRDLQVIDQIRLERWLVKHPDLTDLRSFEDLLAVEGELVAIEAARQVAARGGAEVPESHHPEENVLWMVGVWAAKLQAGEDAPLDDLGRFSYRDIEWDPEPEPDADEGKAEAAPDLPRDRGGSDEA